MYNKMFQELGLPERLLLPSSAVGGGASQTTPASSSEEARSPRYHSPVTARKGGGGVVSPSPLWNLPDVPNDLQGQHVLSADMFSKDQMHALFNLAHAFNVFVLKDRPLDHILKVGPSLDSSSGLHRIGTD